MLKLGLKVDKLKSLLNDFLTVENYVETQLKNENPPKIGGFCVILSKSQ